jgi:hypothetical protein
MTKPPQRNKLYLQYKSQFPEITDDEYRAFMKKRTRLKRNVQSYKRTYGSEDTIFLLEAIDSSNPYNIDDIDLKKLFYTRLYQINNPE